MVWKKKIWETTTWSRYYTQIFCPYLLDNTYFWRRAAVTARWRSDSACRICPLPATCVQNVFYRTANWNCKITQSECGRGKIMVKIVHQLNFSLLNTGQATYIWNSTATFSHVSAFSQKNKTYKMGLGVCCVCFWVCLCMCVYVCVSV